MFWYRKCTALLLSLVLIVLALVCAQSALAQKNSELIHVEIIGAETKDKQSEQVLDALKKLLLAIGQRNMEQIGTCLSSDVVAFDDRKHNLISGKEAVLDHIAKQVLGVASDNAIKSLVVYNPQVDVKGDTAMVSFRAVKEIVGPKSAHLESWCSEIFERKNDQWLVIHFKSNWKPLSAHNEN